MAPTCLGRLQGIGVGIAMLVASAEIGMFLWQHQLQPPAIQLSSAGEVHQSSSALEAATQMYVNCAMPQITRLETCLSKERPPLLSSEQAQHANKGLIMVLSFPNSGTSYTMEWIRRLSGRGGTVYKKDLNPLVNTSGRFAGVYGWTVYKEEMNPPVNASDLFAGLYGCVWADPTSIFEKPPHFPGFLPVKTHGTGYGEIGPTMMQSLTALSGQPVMLESEDWVQQAFTAREHRQSGCKNHDRVAAVLRLYRNPFDNLVARIHFSQANKRGREFDLHSNSSLRDLFADLVLYLVWHHRANKVHSKLRIPVRTAFYDELFAFPVSFWNPILEMFGMDIGDMAQRLAAAMEGVRPQNMSATHGHAMPVYMHLFQQRPEVICSFARVIQAYLDQTECLSTDRLPRLDTLVNWTEIMGSI
mmetsp:Transcript_136328/g.436251  ORF Transcript_136328/g.436251 Transcript_136328/m.436251 type:complete len:416 (+) Transcript_136328:104-1351(+)